MLTRAVHLGPARADLGPLEPSLDRMDPFKKNGLTIIRDLLLRTMGLLPGIMDRKKS